MGLDQKMRSLFCRLQKGIPFVDIETEDGTLSILSLRNVPYELENIFFKWVMALSPEHRLTILHMENGYPEAITEEGWCAFISWSLNALHEAQSADDFQVRAESLFLKRNS